MIKFFRKIRQNLLSEGKTGKYLKYAFGEIVLVMVGILFALQVNNWNQQRVDSKREQKAILDLSKEFKLNAERINSKQNLRISIVPKFEDYIRLIETGKADYKSFEELHYADFVFGMTNLSNGVIDALISSGEISMISNDSLKYFLADWKNQAENLYENENILWDFSIRYVRDFSKTIPDPRQNWNDWDDIKLDLAFQDLISDIEYRNNLVTFLNGNKIVIQECETTIKLLDNILHILNDELKK